MEDPDQQSEHEWIERAKRGQRDSFGLLVEKHMKRAYFAALGFLGNHDEALDLSQEAFVRAFRALPGFQTGRSFYPWFYRILRNLCYNRIRDNRKAPIPFSRLSEEGAEMTIADGEQDPEAMMLRAEERARLWRGLWNLDHEERELIVARDILGTSYAELAELLECPQGTVMSRLFSARRKLRLLIMKEEG